MSHPIDVRNQQLYDLEQFAVPQAVKNDLQGILLPQGLIDNRVARMGEEIAKNYAYGNTLAICVLNGAQHFYQQLLNSVFPSVHNDIQLESIKCCSYDGTKSTGEVQINGLDFTAVRGKNVLVVEDIIDTGLTLSKLAQKLYEHDPLSLEIACLLDKRERRNPQATVKPEYTGFIIPDRFVVGYGLDFNGRYRLLPHLGVLKEEIYQK
ncbi:MAG: phosphoribosyltransferase family protein [Nanoarchaeota archaeon]|nr:phosphoribosyltransferase family protein [Nanoarchaeota archaeon]